MIALESITFTHSPDDPATSALNVRVNAAAATSIPEYTHGSAPLSYAVAYAIDATANQSTFVRARFRQTAGIASTYVVRASGGGVLGSIAQFTVAFTSGQSSVEIDLPLSQRTFSVIGRYDVGWVWELRSGRRWGVLARSTHRIYLLLSIPLLPWTQTPNSTKNPWVDLLDHACVMASGSRTAADAMRALTIRLHSGFALKYDITSANQKYGIGDTRIAGQDKFRMTDWLDWVLNRRIENGAPGAPQSKVCPGNPHEYFEFLSPACFDCAAALTLMARVLGIPADYVFHRKFGYLNYVGLIGRGKANNPFYNLSCIAQDAVVGPDAHRSGVVIHAYVRLGSNVYDVTYSEWLSALQLFALMVASLPDLFLPLKPRRPRYFGFQAFRCITDLPQSDYERLLIDRSAPFETDPNFTGGVPEVLPVDFNA